MTGWQDETYPEHTGWLTLVVPLLVAGIVARNPRQMQLRAAHGSPAQRPPLRARRGAQQSSAGASGLAGVGSGAELSSGPSLLL